MVPPSTSHCEHSTWTDRTLGENGAMMRPPALAGMPAFTVLSVGQGLSNLGTGMTAFAITIWAWELTGQATALALVGLFAFLPQVLAAPFAGALVDRLDRKT